ncbi:MAG TPA: hypothetical protein VFH61_03155 [Thermoleophilia bacterium]|nr:hypothetical protein [Thermoleophilia bacterium]
MAKEVGTIQIVLEIPYASGVRDDANIRVAQVNYMACDSVDAEMRKNSGLHGAEGIPETVITAELGAVGTEGTLLYKIAAVEAAVKTKEGI